MVAEFERQRLELFAAHGFDGESRRVADRRGRTTYIVARGEGTTPTIMVHGGLSHAGEWALLAGRTSGDLVMPDRPGHGLSYPIDYRGLDYRSEAVQWMEDLVDGLGADQVDLIANSMGGYFSIVYALAHPERVRRLVLVGAPAGLHRRVPLFLRLWGTPLIGRLISANPPADPERIRRLIFGTILVARPEEIPDDFLEVMVASMSLPGAGLASHSMLRNVLDPGGWRPGLRLDAEMSRLDVPTLSLWGDADRFASPSRGEEILPDMPDARLEVLDRCGHMPHVDAPGQVAEMATAFLGGALRRG